MNNLQDIYDHLAPLFRAGVRIKGTIEVEQGVFQCSGIGDEDTFTMKFQDIPSGRVEEVTIEATREGQ